MLNYYDRKRLEGVDCGTKERLMKRFNIERPCRVAIYVAALTDQERKDEASAIDMQVEACRDAMRKNSDNPSYRIKYEEVCVAIEDVDKAMQTGRRRVFESLVCAYALGEIDAIYAVDTYHFTPTSLSSLEQRPLDIMHAHLQFANQSWFNYDIESWMADGAAKDLRHRVFQIYTWYENHDSAFESTYQNKTPKNFRETETWRVLREASELLTSEDDYLNASPDLYRDEIAIVGIEDALRKMKYQTNKFCDNISWLCRQLIESAVPIQKMLELYHALHKRNDEFEARYQAVRDGNFENFPTITMPRSASANQILSHTYEELVSADVAVVTTPSVPEIVGYAHRNTESDTAQSALFTFKVKSKNLPSLANIPRLRDNFDYQTHRLGLTQTRVREIGLTILPDKDYALITAFVKKQKNLVDKWGDEPSPKEEQLALKPEKETYNRNCTIYSQMIDYILSPDENAQRIGRHTIAWLR